MQKNWAFTICCVIDQRGERLQLLNNRSHVQRMRGAALVRVVHVHTVRVHSEGRQRLLSLNSAVILAGPHGGNTRLPTCESLATFAK